MQYQNDIIKYKMQFREQVQLTKDKEREFKIKMNEIQEKYKKTIKEIKHDHD